MSVHPSERNEAQRMHVLVSYAYFNTDKHMAVLDGVPKEWNLMLDSGAFTNFTQGKRATNVDDYAAFCTEQAHRFWRIINLDRIGDHEASDRNLRRLHSLGVKALPVFQRGADPELLAGMHQQGFPVCIGGISQNVGSAVERAYLHSVMQVVKRLGVRTHLLGVGGPALFKLPCWSGDSSSWEMASRYGSMGLWYRGKVHKFDKSPTGRKGRAYVKPTLERTAVLRSYGLTWEDLRHHHKWSLNDDSAVYLASIRSWIRVAKALSKVGKRYIFASPVSHLGILARAWAMEKHKWT